MFSHEHHSDHRGSDDLLSAGLGLAGLRSMAPPAFANPLSPTAEELRKLSKLLDGIDLSGDKNDG